jgi:general secretion pathway protein J
MLNTKSRKKWLTLRKKILTTTGFTLIEVMVTLTILGFILLIIFGAFRLGLSAWSRGESTKEEYQKIRVITQLISQQIKSVVPFKIKTKKAEGNYLAFEGKAHALKFVSAFPVKERQAEGFVYAIYEFKEGGKEGGRLVLYEQRALNRDLFAEDPREELGISILEGISNVRFEYYREEDPDNNRAEEWVEEWNAKEEQGLPKALRMIITQKDGKGTGGEIPITILASLPAYRFEEVRTTPLGVGRRTMQGVPQR